MSSSSSSAPAATNQPRIERLLNLINDGRAKLSLRPLEDQNEPSLQLLLGKVDELIALGEKAPNVAIDIGSLLFNREQAVPESAKKVHYYLRVYKVKRTAMEAYKEQFADKEWAQNILDACPADELCLPYVGMTHKDTPAGRAESDKKKKQTRLANAMERIL